MKTLFLASECAPIVKVGGLADVIGSLPKALKKLNLDVRIVIPKYGIIDERKHLFKLIAKNIKVKKEIINIYQGFLPKSEVILYLLENEKYFSKNGVYPQNPFEEISRFLFFSLSILESFPHLNFSPQIIHCHDWHVAILSTLIKIRKLKIKTLLTIHNLLNQGKWNPKEILDFLGLGGDEIESLKIRDKNGNFNILQQGILNSDFLTTVSKNYRQEILTKEYGQSLEKWLLKRKKNLFGILNGIDIEKFNPETDQNLKSNYSISNFERKIENKIDLQKILKLPIKKEIPLFAFIGRLDFQKGIDLISEIIPDLVKLNCQLVILGVGEKEYEKKFLEFSQKYPKNVSSQIKFDPILAQKIYSASDFLLMPSKFEPCGLVSMIALRYGTIPIARKTGGLSDFIKNRENGFLFKENNSSGLLKSIKEALQFYKRKNQFKKLIKSAMKKNFSWEKSAKEYLKLYRKLLNV